ncbi:uncharacterized protein LOC112525931 [Cynara cardunculus var. scolymus]|uniref:Uncharacterized protein n=1 Tax=Cynara cardunculus var. scolymus TaxID=59895 RepID=A0A103Y8W6_CYNCS|nr:uncharacterized protein LOC112525931 [Cynara cardunculus var. scolymus]KVI04677.1 hypothetical protein Ccrd_017004 [Cynara cardunculus var. scolymus]
MERGKAASGIRKGKKKQVKDELDRNKQAEKKKRRLEKTLATSAAIISELERKKEKKKEEQQRLDEEGAAIAEAVALQVLIGEDPEEPNSWNRARNFDLYVGGSGSGTTAAILSDHQLSTSPNEETGWVFNGHWNGFGSFISDFRAPCYRWPAEVIVADVASSLQIVDDEDVDAFVYNRTLS